MNQKDRIRRTAILCSHCIRNFAFYKAGWKQRKLRINRQFWVNANGNFLEIALLEWCKLFADRAGKHHWRKVIRNQSKFESNLYSYIGMTKREFKAYAQTVLKYRNKFIAHLDDEVIAFIPFILPALKSAIYLYDHLVNDRLFQKYLMDAHQSATRFYRIMYRHANQEYQKAIFEEI